MWLHILETTNVGRAMLNGAPKNQGKGRNNKWDGRASSDNRMMGCRIFVKPP